MTITINDRLLLCFYTLDGEAGLHTCLLNVDEMEGMLEAIGNGDAVRVARAWLSSGGVPVDEVKELRNCYGIRIN